MFILIGTMKPCTEYFSEKFLVARLFRISHKGC